MARVTLYTRPGIPGGSIETEPGVPVSRVLRLLAVPVAQPCGGRGTCGKCVVLVCGELSAPQQAELDLLRRLPLPAPPAGFVHRLACRCSVLGDAGLMAQPGGQHAAAMAAFEADLPACDGEDAGRLGAAVDIGTTTVTLALYHLGGGALLATRHQMNRQETCGADVLSRIEAANRDGFEGQHRVIAGQLAEMLGEALDEAGAGPGQVGRLVVTGNTTMLHFLAGLDPRGIGVSPFVPQSLFGFARPAAELLPFLPADAELYLPPCVSAYVGADVTCGMLAGGFARPGGPLLLVDVGTNGEMALRLGGAILCCATAAGPAFEGAQIGMGMPAIPGAVCRVEVRRGRIVCHTIGGAPPLGLCGTGLISAVKAMLEAGVLDGTGLIRQEGHPFAALVRKEAGDCRFYLGDSGVWLSQQDIRSIQLAKAAIAAGIDTLLAAAGTAPQRVEALLLAGGFGSTIDAGEAAAIGLIPRALKAGARAAGNAALAGAARLLFSRGLRAAAEGLAAGAREVPLSTSPVFMDRYVENMPFYEE